MPRKGEAMPAHTRAKVSASSIRTRRRKRERELTASLVLPAHVGAWIKAGLVHTSIRSMIDAYTAQIGNMVQDMGGPEEISAMQRAMLDNWMRAAVAGDCEFQRLLKHPNEGVPEKLATCLNSARSSLLALGLHRRARTVEQSLVEIITIKAQAAQDADEAACVPLSSTNASDSAPAPCPVDDDGSDEERTS